MAKRITDLPEQTTPAPEDIVPIVDVSTNTTKWMTLVNLLTNFIDAVHIKANAIITDKLLDGAVTTRKFKPTTISWIGSTLSNATTNSTTMIDVPSCSFNYTSGDTPETLFLWPSCMFNVTGSAGHVGIMIGGVDQDLELGYNAFTNWVRAERLYTYNVAANTTITIKFRYKIENSASTISFHRGTIYRPQVKGFAVYNGS